MMRKALLALALVPALAMATPAHAVTISEMAGPGRRVAG